MTPLEKFVRLLRETGWQELRPFQFRKGESTVVFDTSSWMEVSTKSNPRVFDISVPGDHEAGWTVNLIEHLCRSEDERFRLRSALDEIRRSPTCGARERSIAERAT